MIRQRWILGAIVAVVLANAGCVTCCHKSHQKAWEHGAECDLPAPCRGQVYVFLIHGLTPSCDCGLNALRMKLAENGFAKIGVGELASAPCVAKEIKSIQKCEPEARFVLVGYDFGGAAAVSLARDLNAQCVPVEAVVLLDPLGCGEPCGLRTLLITSGTTSKVPYTNRLVVSDATHYKLPAHPRTVEAITGLLSEIATNGYQEGSEQVWEWSYKHAPEMRATPKSKVGPDWKFLADTSEIPPAITARVVTESQSTIPTPAAPSNSTSAGPVLIKP